MDKVLMALDLYAWSSGRAAGEILRFGCLPLGPHSLAHVFARAKNHLLAFKEFASDKMLESFIVAAAVVIAESGKGPQQFFEELSQMWHCDNGGDTMMSCYEDARIPASKKTEKASTKHRQMCSQKKNQKVGQKASTKTKQKASTKHVKQKSSQKKSDGNKVQKQHKKVGQQATKTKPKVSTKHDKQKSSQKKSDGKQKASTKKKQST